MQCVILAGGLGTRMRPMTETMPKWLLPVAGRPFAEWQLDWLAAQGVGRVVVSVGHMADMIADFAAINAGRWPFHLGIVDDGQAPLGTLGALRRACDQADLGGGVLVLYGDSYLDVDVRAVWATSQSGTRPVMTVLRNDGRWDTSNARVADGRVALYEKHRPDAAGADMNWIDYGLSALPVERIRNAIAAGETGDLADLMHTLSVEGELLAFEVVNRFYEIGSPDGLADLEAHLAASA